MTAYDRTRNSPYSAYDDHRDKDSATLEREANATRSSLSATLDALRGKLTPGQMLDEAMRYTTGGRSAGLGSTLTSSVASGLASGLASTARQNPLPTLLIGAGLAMYMSGTSASSLARTVAGSVSGSMSGSRRKHRGGFRSGSGYGYGYGSDEEFATAQRVYHPDYNGDRYEDDSRYADERERSQSGRSGGMRERMGERMGSVASSISERASGVAGTVGETVSSVGARVGEAYESTTHMMRERLHDARDYSAETFEVVDRRVRGGISTMVREQPLAVAAIGLALGAAIGAMLPRTRMEDDLMGDTADRVKEQASGLARQQYENAQHIASEVMDEARHQAEEQGLTTDTLAETAKDIAGRVKTVASNVANSAQDKAKSAVTGSGTSSRTSPSATMPGRNTNQRPLQQAAGGSDDNDRQMSGEDNTASLKPAGQPGAMRR